MYKCRYFDIKELVSPKVYEKFGEFAWRFFDENILMELDYIRKEWGSSININDWAWGGIFKESGLRSNVDSIVVQKTYPYLSGHVLGKGFDMRPKNGQHTEFYNFLWNLLQTGRLKRFKRMENIKYTPGWAHIDALRTDSGKPEIFSI